MNILTVFAIPYYMATLARCAPLSNSNELVDSPQMQKITQTSRSLVEKIRLSIPDTHASCIRSETLQLNSSENTKFTIMASNIGIPAAPVLKAVSESFPLETCLKRISEGLQLHRALLAAVAPRLKHQDEVTDLQADIRDLIIHINKMLKMLGGEAVAQPTVAPVSLNLEGTYEVQVAAHLTLVQLQSFALDVACCLRSLDRSNEEDADRYPPGD